MKMLKHSLYLATICLYLVSAGAEAGAGKQKKLLCWTNSEGVRECGDRLPPEYAQEGHEELSKSGRVIKETERAKTEEERAEEKRLAEIKAEEEKAIKEQARKDKILLDTFASVKDIEQARDSKIGTFQSTISLAEKRGVKLQESLDSRVNQAAAAERQGKTPPPQLLADIDSLKRQIKDNDEFIENTRKEQESVKSGYDKDIERFQELTSSQ